MTNIGVVSVSMSTLNAGTPVLCSAGAGTTTAITFRQNPGNLQQLKIISQLTNAQVSITTTQQGTKENVVCSNRGLCDTSLGTCTCLQAFTSSNGQGAAGTLGDCGALSGNVVYNYMLTSCPSTCNVDPSLAVCCLFWAHCWAFDVLAMPLSRRLRCCDRNPFSACRAPMFRRHVQWPRQLQRCHVHVHVFRRVHGRGLLPSRLQPR